MRKKIVAANWKMNKNYKDGFTLLKKSLELLADEKKLKNVSVVFATPFIHLKRAAKMLKDDKNFFIGAQNCFWEEEGAYTGEISAAMIASTGADYVIIGHSERRQYFNETNEQLAKKINVALKYNLTPIFCAGEPLDQREGNMHFEFVEKQIHESLFHLTKEEVKKIVIAYEPVWAIGTGKNATKEQAQDMHAYIRKLLAHQYDIFTAEEISILYGGSCKPGNAHELFTQPDIDGGLIGGASLKAEEFAAIVKSF